MTTNDRTTRDIAPKLTPREWTKIVRTMEGQYKYHTDKANSASFPLLQGYHWEQSMICDRVVKELKRAQIEGGDDE